MWLGRIVNSDTFQTIDPDRALANIAWGIGTFWYAESAMCGENYVIDAVSYGETTGQDFTPFAFVWNIPDELAHVKSALYAIHEFCYSLWLRWEELNRIVSDNAAEFLVAEIDRVESFLEDSEDTATLSDQEISVLTEYKRRLAMQMSRFSAFILSSTVENVKNNVSQIHDSEASELQWIIGFVSNTVRAIVPAWKKTQKAA